MPIVEGMKNHTPLLRPTPLADAAKWLRVDPGWLRAEIEAGHLPGLIAGETVLVDLALVAKALLRRAAEGGGSRDN